VIVGYEVVGTIIQKGKKVEGFEEGDS